MSTYYNEIDSYAARWLRNLISAGELPEGIVDERSIEEIKPEELAGYTQVHLFAGIGGWPYALKLAGWPDDRPVWTGSCPCQPLSSAGQRKGHTDRRHLWPAFYRLISECCPAVVIGEQVASTDGREWFAAVRADLEGSGYACGCADLAAASVGSPHIRQRLFWVADGRTEKGGVASSQSIRSGDTDGLADAGSERRQQESRGSSRYEGSHGRQQDGGHVAASGGEDDGLADAMHTERRAVDVDREDGRNRTNGGRRETHGEPGARCEVRGLGDADEQGPQGRSIGPFEHSDQCTPWSSSELIPCADGKTRVTQPGLRPLAHGVPARVGRLRAYGNAIVPQVAAEFISAFMDCKS